MSEHGRAGRALSPCGGGRGEGGAEPPRAPRLGAGSGAGAGRRRGGAGAGAGGGGGEPSEPEGGLGKGVLHLEARQEALQGRGQGVEEGRREAGEKEIISSDL